ncbi:MAG: HAD-IA family hydrolase [Candidatus Dormiibacterota bacterium]
MIFDLDKVLTDAASIHGLAWKRVFDAYFAEWARGHGATLDAFDPVADYRAHMAGRPPNSGVAAILAARGIELDAGCAEDPPERQSVWGLANRKREAFGAVMAVHAVAVRPPAVDLLRQLRAAGVLTAVLSHSHHAAEIMESAGLDELFTVCVDGVEMDRLGLRRRPLPDLYSEALARLSVEPGRAAAVEGASQGVMAARAAGVGLVVWVDAPASDQELVRSPTDAVLSDLRGITVAKPAERRPAAGPGPRNWALAFDSFDPLDERRREAICATGNGYLVTRGAAPESEPGPSHYPGSYLAGVYDRQTAGPEGSRLATEELVNAPNWLPITFRIEGGGWFGGPDWTHLAFGQELDIRHGVLSRRVQARDPAGRITTVLQRRLVSMADAHLAAMETVLIAENWSGRIEVRSGLDGNVSNSGVASHRPISQPHLTIEHLGSAGPSAIGLVAATRQSGIRIGMVCRHLVGGPSGLVRTVEVGGGRVDERFSGQLGRGEELIVTKVVAVYTSRDPAQSDCLTAASEKVETAGDFDQLLAAHRVAWERLWARCQVWMDVRGRTPLIVHLHLFHLLQSISPHTAALDAGVTARGLHGEAYRGHVFWDELFVFPLLNFRFPEITRALLGYRYRRLDPARRLAAEAGRRGAMFPWRSGSEGGEETPPRLFNPRSNRWMSDSSHLQRHVGLSIAHSVWHYYQVTGDLEYLSSRGAELMIEIARFWVSAARYNPDRARYDIGAVMGPDEFHDGPPQSPGAGLLNNAYTNVMAAWVLWRTRQTVELLRGHGGSRLFERLDLRPEELSRWDRIGRRLTVPFDSAGRISQFSGYEDLEELDWEAYRRRYGDIGRLDLILEAEGDSPNRYKAAKQADVLMLLFMLSAEELGAVLGRLGYRFDPATIPEMVHYYLARTTNGSTLSRVAHAWVLSRSDRAASWRLLSDALAADVDDLQRGTTQEGIHLGAMAGTVDLLQRCYVDLDARDDTLHINPRLPDELQRLRFGIDYRGQRLELDVTHESLLIRARPSIAPSVRIAVREMVFQFAGGESRTLPLGAP